MDSDRNVYLSTDGGRAYKFSSSGVKLWTFDSGRELLPAMHIDGTTMLPAGAALINRTLFNVRVDCTVFALDAISGKLLWSTKAEFKAGSDTASVSAGEGVVVTACSDEGWAQGGNNKIVALDALSGKKLWTYVPANCVYNFMASIVAGSVVFEDSQGDVYRLSLSNGNLLWHAPAEARHAWSTATVAVGSNNIVYAAHNIVDESGLQRGVLTSYNLEDGSLRWSKHLEFGANSGPAVGDLTGTGRGPLSVLFTIGTNPDIAKPTWLQGKEPLERPWMGDEPLNPHNLSDDTKPARIMALDALTGDLRWEFTLPDWHGVSANDTLENNCWPDSFANPSIGGDGTGYVVGESGRVYAVRDKNGDGFVREADGEVSFFDTYRAFQAAPAIGPGILAVAPCNGLAVFLQD